MSWRSASPASIVLPSPHLVAEEEARRKPLDHRVDHAVLVRPRGDCAGLDPDARRSGHERRVAQEAEGCPFLRRRLPFEWLGGRPLGRGAFQEALADGLRQRKGDPSSSLAIPERLETPFDVGDPMIGRRNGVRAIAARPSGKDLEYLVVLPPASPRFVDASAERQLVARRVLKDPLLGVVVLLGVRSWDREAVGPHRQHDPDSEPLLRDQPCQDLKARLKIGGEVVVPFKRPQHGTLRRVLDRAAPRFAAKDSLHVARRKVGPAQQAHGSIVLDQSRHPGGSDGKRRAAKVPGRAAVPNAPLQGGKVEIVQPIIHRAVGDSERMGWEVQCAPGPDGRLVNGMPFWPFGANNVNRPSAEARLASPWPRGPAVPRHPGRTRAADRQARAPRGGRALPSS